jgi:hypothetical protein
MMREIRKRMPAKKVVAKRRFKAINPLITTINICKG